MPERQLTSGPGGRILTNCHVWSPDGQWIVFDTRSDPAGGVFDGTRIQAVNVETKEIRTLYEWRNGACCGVATWNPAGHPTDMKVAFILGPEHPTPEWSYGISRRQGVIVSGGSLSPRATSEPTLGESRPPYLAIHLDARNLTPPYTPGALRGGSHVHVWHPAGDWVCFTYDDEVIKDAGQRNVGVAVPRRVTVPTTHPRNHDGDYFSALVTRTVANPRDGSDEISRACEEAWVGNRRMLAFQGTVNVGGKAVPEVFVVDLPDDLTQPGDGPLEGSATERPHPPRGVTQRRLTFGGVNGPRHWLRSSPDGARIGFLRHDAAGVVQFWTVSPNGSEPVQVTSNPHPVASCFTWHPDGRRVAFVLDNSVCLADVATGSTTRLTARTEDATAPRPEACVVSPDGSRVAFVRRLPDGGKSYNQVCVVEVP